MIVFACPNPNCRKRYKVADNHAGKATTCTNPECGLRIQVPYPPCKPDPIPADLIDEGTGAVLKDWRDELSGPPSPHRNQDAAPSYVQSTATQTAGYDDPPLYDEPLRYRRSRRGKLGQANRITAGIGGAMLLLGLFLPMVHAPFGIWMSFIDLPWKALTIGLNAAANAAEERDLPRREQPPVRVQQPAKNADTASGVVTAVAAASILYPLCIGGVVATTFFHVCTGRTRGLFAVLGGLSIVSTLLYAIALLALSTQNEFRVVMVFTSPGFGWAVVLIGASALTYAGVLRTDTRD